MLERGSDHGRVGRRSALLGGGSAMLAGTHRRAWGQAAPDGMNQMRCDTGSAVFVVPQCRTRQGAGGSDQRSSRFSSTS